MEVEEKSARYFWARSQRDMRMSMGSFPNQSNDEGQTHEQSSRRIRSYKWRDQDNSGEATGVGWDDGRGVEC